MFYVFSTVLLNMFVKFSPSTCHVFIAISDCFTYVCQFERFRSKRNEIKENKFENGENHVVNEFLCLSGSFTLCQHLRPSSGQQHTVISNLFSPVMMIT